MADDSEIALSIAHVNDNSVDGDDDTRPMGSKRAKITKSNEEFVEDRLSELPDALLLHILSSVCTKQAAQTSVLSKRWQFLWIDLPVIVLRETNREIKISVGHNQAAALSPNDKLDLVLPPLCHLKNVNISGFLETCLAGESMLILVQLLLSTAPSLEKMVISAKDLTGHSSTSCSSTDLTKIAQKLLSFPRASPKAVVMVH